MKIPSNDEILAILDQLDASVADDLESYWLEFKPWRDPKEDMRVAAETAACFANADGGVIVFGVADRIRGRVNAIHGASRYDMSIWRSSIFASTRPNLDVEVGELPVDEGSGKLLVVRVQRGLNPPYGTAEGMYKVQGQQELHAFRPAGLGAHSSLDRRGGLERAGRGGSWQGGH